MIKDFEQRLEGLNKEKIRSFLTSLKSPCYESELMKVAFENIDILKTDSLALYQNHFLLFYALYKLQDEYYKEDKYLHIHFMRTFLVDYPSSGYCRFYDEHSGSFCRSATSENPYYCDFHYEKVNGDLEGLSIKYFYFDIDNFYKLDKEKADAFINGAWEIFSNYDEYKKSLSVLELTETANLEAVKKQFKTLAKKYHPDLGETNHKKFNEINQAYRLLLRVLPVFYKK
ncbi:MAG TPA: DnaJ domain-containing protein [Spirochaetota bacterium]|nr:DnaJ domain-containing protein [Spirochaetota bacterium]